MMLNPEAQRRAHEEIDRVVGDSRLPDFSDREDLPYVDCLQKEVFRFVQPHSFPAFSLDGGIDGIQ